MSQKFILEIELGNAAMRSPRDVTRALIEVANGELRRYNREDLRDRREGANQKKIYDLNGNVVGSWRFTPDESPAPIRTERERMTD